MAVSILHTYFILSSSWDLVATFKANIPFPEHTQSRYHFFNYLPVYICCSLFYFIKTHQIAKHFENMHFYEYFILG